MATTLTENDVTRAGRRWFRGRNLDDIKLPDMKMPDVNMPDVKMPDVRMPDIKFDGVKLPDGIKLPDGFKLPDGIKLPDNLKMAGLPSRMDLPGGLELRRRPALRVPVAIIAAIGGLIGAAAVFLLDPAVGHRRRALVRDRVASTARHLVRRGAHVTRRLTSDASGLGQRIRNVGDQAEPLDEVELAHKVETEIFRDGTIDKGRLNINAERDVVFLRGTAPTLEEIAGIEDRVRKIDGVRHVVNLLHLPGTTAPADSYHEEPTPSQI
jgi:hypothetical protein